MIFYDMAEIKYYNSGIYMDAKKLYNYLDDVYSKIYKSEKNEWIRSQKYSIIINILMVYLGLRPAYLLEVHGHGLNINDQLEINKQLKTFGLETYNKYDNILFANKKEIIKRNIENEYNEFINRKNADMTNLNIILGKLLGYKCPNDIGTNMHNYIKKKDNKLRMRYIIEFYVMTKENKNLKITNMSQIFAFICYDLKKKDEYYKQCKKDLVLYQREIGKITNDVHISLRYTEEII